jgi:hypothetical protein
MAAPVERPATPLGVVVIGAVLVVVVGFIALKIIIGFVITLVKIAIAVGFVVAMVAIANRLFDNSDD